MAIVLLLGNVASMAGCADRAASNSDRTVVKPSLSGKYNPGHYVAMNLRDGRDDLSTILKPGIVGVQVRYSWIDLEPEYDRYDFSVIEANLDLLEESGHQLVALIMDKSFVNERYTPPYLWEEYTVKSNAHKGGVGFVSKRWDPYVVERFNKLITQLGRAFDKRQNFEGIAIQESAIGISLEDRLKMGYSARAYRDALICNLQQAAQSLPNSRVFWYMNFLAGGHKYIAEIATAVAPFGVAIGGPDILPGHPPLERHVYPVLRSLEGTVKFNSAQNDSFRWERETDSQQPVFWAPDEIFEYARDNLGVDYLFWNHRSVAKPRGSYTYKDALEVITAEPHFNRTTDQSASRTYSERVAGRQPSAAPALSPACINIESATIKDSVD